MENGDTTGRKPGDNNALQSGSASASDRSNVDARPLQRTRGCSAASSQRPGRRTSAMLVAACAITALAIAVQPVLAQSWWPFGGADRGPIPSEPVYRPPPRQAPAPRDTYSPGWTGNRAPICLQLEQRLAYEANRGNKSREELPRLEGEVRAADRSLQASVRQLDRADCFDFFLFAKSLKRTRQCVTLSNRVEAAKRQLSDLEGQRQQLMQSNGRSFRDDIVSELARNNCGPGYQQQARNSNPFSSLWQDQEGNAQDGNKFGTLPFATYRTICVRLCDGYFFPVSFSTLPNHFDRDADVCQQKCAAPAELYFYQNPGAAVDQAVSHKSQSPYTSLKTAFRYRKEYVSGCSCKQAEYLPNGGASPASAGKRAQARPPSGAADGWAQTTVRAPR